MFGIDFGSKTAFSGGSANSGGGGQWFLAQSIDDLNARASQSYLFKGDANISLHTWYDLALTVTTTGGAAIGGGGGGGSGTVAQQQHFLTGHLNSARVFGPVAMAQTTTGNVALGTGQYNHVQFDNVDISATPVKPDVPTPSPPTPAPQPAPPSPKNCSAPAVGTSVHLRGCELDPKNRCD
jgi:hypothetical protein